MVHLLRKRTPQLRISLRACYPSPTSRIFLLLDRTFMLNGKKSIRKIPMGSIFALLWNTIPTGPPQLTVWSKSASNACSHTIFLAKESCECDTSRCLFACTLTFVSIPPTFYAPVLVPLRFSASLL